MAYIVIKTIKGRAYLYLQRSWREGRKVRTSAICLGPVGGSRRRRRSAVTDEYERKRREHDAHEACVMARLQRENEELDEWQRKTFGETAAERGQRLAREHLEQLHADFGLRMPGSDPKPPSTR